MFIDPPSSKRGCTPEECHVLFSTAVHSPRIAQGYMALLLERPIIGRGRLNHSASTKHQHEAQNTKREASWDDHRRKHIRLQHNQDAHQSRQCQTVEENEAQNLSFMSVPPGGSARYYYRLRVNHFPHHTA